MGTYLGTSSVTQFSDVTNAGSGQIITAGERTLLSTALQAGSNVSVLTNDAGYLTALPAITGADITDGTIANVDISDVDWTKLT